MSKLTSEILRELWVKQMGGQEYVDQLAEEYKRGTSDLDLEVAYQIWLEDYSVGQIRRTLNAIDDMVFKYDLYGSIWQERINELKRKIIDGR